MPTKTIIHDLKRKIPWSFISVALALVFGALTVYQAFFHQKSPAISVEILSNASVLDVKEEIAGLDIQYNKRDIRKSNEYLRVITVRIENTGNQSILKSFYDSKDPFGIKITKGKLIEEPTVLAANSDYIRNNLSPKVDGNDVILFSDIIIEANQFFVIKLLLLHKQDGDPPTIEKTVGTIAGLKSITILETPGEKPKKSIWAEAFSGSILIQVIRCGSYFLGMIIIMVCTVAPPVIISDALSKNRRKSTIADYKLVTDIDLSEKDDFLFDKYIEHGSTYILRVERLFRSSSLLNYVCSLLKDESEELEPVAMFEESIREIKFTDASIIYSDKVVARLLLKKGYITKGSEDKYEVDDHAKQVLEDFSNYLRKRKLIILSDRYNHSSAEIIE